MSIRVGVLLRHEDETGVSGTGIKAHVVEFPSGAIIGRWISEFPSFFWFENLKAASHIHGHGGKTEFVFYDEVLPPGTPEELEKMLVTPSEEEASQELVETIASEVVKQLEEPVLKKSARLAVRKMLARQQEVNPLAEKEEKSESD